MKYRVDLNSFDNAWYSTGKSKIYATIWYFISVFLFQSSAFPFYSIKIYFLKIFGCKVGKGLIIKPGVRIKYPWLLEIGDHVWIGENVWIDNLARVQLASNVCLSQGAMLLTGSHNYKSRDFGLMIGEIKLEEGVWIGAKAVVCPGVACRSHSVLTVASVATKDLEPYAIYQGVPASRIRERTILS